MSFIEYKNSPREVYRRDASNRVALKPEYSRDLQVINLEGIEIAYANSDRPCTLLALKEEQLGAIHRNESRLRQIIEENTTGKTPEKLLVACYPGIRLIEGDSEYTADDLNLFIHRN